MTDSPRQERFDRAFRRFIDAHARGMQCLRDGDLHGFEHAVADECAAVEKASAAVNDAVAAARHAAVEPPADSGSDLSIEHEHTRLFEQMKVLEREHSNLETRPRYIEAHRHHRARLRAHIARLRVHLNRLRARSREQRRLNIARRL